MAFTKAAVDSVLVARVGPIMSAVSFSVATDGTNPNTVESIRIGLQSLGFNSASLTAITDADLAGVSNDDLPQLVDVSEWALRTACLDALQDVDSQVDRDSQKLSQLADRWAAKIDKLFAQLKSNYGYGASSLVAGSINLGFAETNSICDQSRYFD